MNCECAQRERGREREREREKENLLTDWLSMRKINFNEKGWYNIIATLAATIDIH